MPTPGPLRTVLAATCFACPLLLSAAPTTTHLRVHKIYSTLDGVAQAVELQIVRVDNEPLVLAGKVMVVRDRRGTRRTVALDRDTAGFAPYASRSRILVGTLDDAWGPYSDVVMPIATMPIDGGTISIDGWDELAYGRLPEDGRHALARDGDVVPADFSPWGSYDIAETVVTEFHHAGFDHYFATNRADEIDLLLSGDIPGWQPTGKAFGAYARARSDDVGSVCRYLLRGPAYSSHFLSVWSAECSALENSGGAILESSSIFLAGIPGDDACGWESIRYPNGQLAAHLFNPIYRLWNGKAAANHRYVVDMAERDAMVARGWISEGTGKDGIGLCGFAYPYIYPWHGSRPDF